MPASMWMETRTQGEATFLENFGPLIAGDLVTATTTDPAGNTSELSPVLVATGPIGPSSLRVVPCERTAGWETFEIRAFDQAFTEANTPVIRWDGTPLATTFVSATEIRATVPAETLGNVRDAVTISIEENGAPSNAYLPVDFIIPRSSSDADCDGEATILDALRVRTVVAALAPNTGPCSASADRRGIFPNASDALWVLRELVGFVPDPLFSTNP